MVAAVIAVALLLAFANGANDNFKGVATLLGSRTGSYRKVLVWATVTTFLGSLAAIVLAGELLARFQGKGLVSPEVAGDPGFVTAVALGAALTVLLATRLGMPTSTTHALIGALVGAGFALSGPVHFEVLANKFVVPLLTSPFLALGATAVLYPLFRSSRRWLGVTEDSCFCVGEEVVEVMPVLSGALAAEHGARLSASLGTEVSCQARYSGRVLGLRAAPTLDKLHYLSAGAMSFARGLNDTPKIAALLLVAPAFGVARGSTLALLFVGVVIALGGWIASRRVAQTMSFGITPMNAGQGFTTNLVTCVLVGIASPLGLPVSTTHVSNGALFGLGLVRRDADWRTIRRILLTWIVTLPLAALIAFGVASLLS